MTISNHLKLYVSAGCLAFALSSQAYAQNTPTSTRQANSDFEMSETVKQAKLELTFAESNCFSGGPEGLAVEYEAIREKYEVAYLALQDAIKDYSVAQQTKILEDHPYFLNCPPKMEKHDNGSQSAFSQVAIFFGGHSTVKAPQAGYGVEIIPGAEKFVAKSDSSLSGLSFGGRVGLQKWEIGIEYTDVSGYSEGQIANGTENVGIVYHDDTVGSTGVAIGPRGLDVEVATEYVGASFLVARELTYAQKEFYAGLGILVTNTEHKAVITTPSFVDIRSESEQEIDETFFFLSAQTELPIIDNINNGGIFSFSLLPQLELGLRHAELGSRQWNMCGVCGAAEQDFTVDIEDDDFGFYYGFNIGAELKAQVSERASIGVHGNAYWRSHNAAIINPETGDDLFIRNSPTHLETDDAHGYGARVFITSTF